MIKPDCVPDTSTQREVEERVDVTGTCMCGLYAAHRFKDHSNGVQLLINQLLF